MPEQVDSRKVFSLLDVNNSIRRTLSERYGSAFWVTAEMNKLNYYSHSGHCYPELVEKKDGKIIAQINAHLWRADYNRVNEKFRHVLGEPLKNGIKILFLASISFDPVYGLSLWIKDIDPSYSLGELEREKQQTIDRLKAESLWDKNKQLCLPVLPQRIAIISVETSKGYSDFLKVIDQNPFGYHFFHFLFPALLQGERSVISILNQLKRIKKVADHFDVVAIIRGGGGDVGLSFYNTYALASAIASFPLPVFTGIGHSTNETVSEMVAYKNAITPTELGDWLLQQFHNFAVPVQQAQDKISQAALQLVTEEKRHIQELSRYCRSVSQTLLLKQHQRFQSVNDRLVQQSRTMLQQNKYAVLQLQDALGRTGKDRLKQQLTILGLARDSLATSTRHQLQLCRQEMTGLLKTVSLLDPVNVLRRGYSLSLYKGKIIRSIDDLPEAAEWTTRLADGNLEGKLISKQKTNKQ